MLLNLTQADPKGEAELVASRILQAIAQPVALPQGIVQIQASIGIALYPSCAATIDQCLRVADMAMYRAKQSGKGCYVTAPEASIVPDERAVAEA